MATAKDDPDNYDYLFKGNRFVFEQEFFPYSRSFK